MASTIAMKCSKNFDARSSSAGLSLASSRAMASIVTQKKAIHAVPSACSRCPPVGSGRERSKTPMLSRPRNPPEKRCRPLTSLRFTHQVKLSTSFKKLRERKSRSRAPRGPVIL